MAVDTQAREATPYAGRARGVWTVIVLATLLFCVLCAATFAGAYSYLANQTRSEHASLQLVHGSQLVVLRHRRLDQEAVTKSTALNEGDEVRTGPDTEANIDLFDGSTVHLYFQSTLTLSKLRTSRFAGSLKEVSLDVISGTAVVSTADLDDFSQAGYFVTTPNSEIHVERNSSVRVQVNDRHETPGTQVIVTAGSATVSAGGRRSTIEPGKMALAGDNGSLSLVPAEQELIRNGDFRDPPTSGAELVENGGLGTSAWLPIHLQSGDVSVAGGTVGIQTENLPGQNIKAAVIDLNVQKGRYTRVGFTQELNAPASFLRYLGLSLTTKIVAQTEPVGGPQSDVFPLTVRVVYLDPNGKEQEWMHSFYLLGAQDLRNPRTTAVPLGTWFTPPQRLVLKNLESGTNVGQDFAVVKAIELYGIGDRLQSWITDVSLIGR